MATSRELAITINLVHIDLLDTVAALRNVVDDLESERRSTDRQVDTLLDGGWSGAAASAYLEGWDKWRAGSDQVLLALRDMAELLVAVRVDFVAQDEAAEANLQSLTSHLLGRLS